MVSYEYFMDVMQPYEVRTLVKNAHYTMKQEKEIARRVMWSNIQPLNKRRIDEKKLIPLVTDKPDNLVEVIKSEAKVQLSEDEIYKNIFKLKEGDSK